VLWGRACRPKHPLHMGNAHNRGRRGSGAAPMGTDNLAAPIIFCDVDGVLNSRASREDGDHMPTAEHLSNLVHAAQGCTLVLSSTWRLDPVLAVPLAAVLESVGLRVYSKTPDLEATSSGDRVDEILLWLREHRAESLPWVAIDDLDLLAMNPRLVPRNFVRTRDSVGLTRANAEEAISAIRSQCNELETAAAAAPAGSGSGLALTLAQSTSLSDSEAHLRPWLEALRAAVEGECSDEPALPVRVSAHILLGDMASAADVDRLLEAGVTRVLNAGGMDARACSAATYAASGLAYLELGASDDIRYDMTPHVEPARDFVRAARHETHSNGAGGTCLLHCQRGVNRSGFLACACLMLEEQLPLLEALERCKRARGLILLNGGFQLQLVRLARRARLLGPDPEPAIMG